MLKITLRTLLIGLLGSLIVGCSSEETVSTAGSIDVTSVGSGIRIESLAT